jgi:hypothetical protein
MFNNLFNRVRQSIVPVENLPIAEELKTRQQIAFWLLDPQVQIIKRSPTVQLAYGTIVSGLLLTGNFGSAAVLTALWCGSRPLTHVVAGGVAGVGFADSRLLARIEHLQTRAARPA